jgi:hypothetical protein
MHPAAQQMIRKVEELSGKPVHVMEDPSLKVMAVVTPARGAAPAHFLRYRPGVAALDYVIVYQLGLAFFPSAMKRRGGFQPPRAWKHALRSMAPRRKPLRSLTLRPAG